jgi:starch-binding outer membrane protein, SusD/RagB family
MKYFHSFAVLFFILLIPSSCQKGKPGRQSLGDIDPAALASLTNINNTIIEIYSMLNGNGTIEERTWQTPVNNWIYGDATSGDACKGTTEADQPLALQIETFRWDPGNEYFNARWLSLYEGIAQCNKVLVLCAEARKVDEADLDRYRAEVRFLRGHYHFEARKLWGNVPFIDENTKANQWTNAEDIWPRIAADFEFSAAHLPGQQPAPGRVTRWAAIAYLAKLHLYRGAPDAAKPLLDDIIRNGPYSLETCYFDNFSKAAGKYNEAIFEIQYVVGDVQTEQGIADVEEVLRQPSGGPREYCKYHQPTFHLVNAFQTDEKGLPLLAGQVQTEVKNDLGIASDEPFTPHKGYLDPRLDWTVGRRGLPFLDYGLHPGKDWIWDQAFAGPYSMKKNILSQADKTATVMSSSWAQGADSKNYRLIRFAQILLWRAEIAVEEGDLDYALELVNRLRLRARDGCVLTGADGKPAANYLVMPWPAFPDREFARAAVRLETRLELGMEGHRFFDLLRWGVAEQEINAYLQAESLRRPYLAGVRFRKGVHERFPIPQKQLERYSGLQQNPGY